MSLTVQLLAGSVADECAPTAASKAKREAKQAAEAPPRSKPKQPTILETLQKQPCPVCNSLVGRIRLAAPDAR